MNPEITRAAMVANWCGNFMDCTAISFAVRAAGAWRESLSLVIACMIIDRHDIRKLLGQSKYQSVEKRRPGSQLNKLRPC